MNLNDNKYQEVENRYNKRLQADEIMRGFKNVGWWLKDMNYSFLEISEEAANILYWLSADDCIGKTDFEITKEQGLEICEEWFAEVCRGSDLYVLNNPVNWEYKSTVFFEFITSSTGAKHIWRVLKSILPSKEWTGVVMHGQAEFMNRIMGYKKADEMIKSDPNLIKINDNLYVTR